MIIKLTADNIIANWEAIKYGALKASNVTEKQVDAASIGLLINLLKNDYQCWACLSDDMEIKTMLVTRIHEDVFKVRHILIESAFGYSPSTEQDKAEYIAELDKFGINQGMKGGTISALTSNPMAENAMRKMGMSEAFKVYSKQIGGV